MEVFGMNIFSFNRLPKSCLKGPYNLHFQQSMWDYLFHSTLTYTWYFLIILKKTKTKKTKKNSSHSFFHLFGTFCLSVMYQYDIISLGRATVSHKCDVLIFSGVWSCPSPHPSLLSKFPWLSTHPHAHQLPVPWTHPCFSLLCFGSECLDHLSSGSPVLRIYLVNPS